MLGFTSPRRPARPHAFASVLAGVLAAASWLPSTAHAQPAIELPPPPPAADAAAAPETGLPRETPIENPLGRAPVIQGSAFGGYGELTLNAVQHAPDGPVVDLRRFVLYFGHNFSDRLRFYSEVEVEHAVSSADDQGEVEIEQAFLDGLLGRRLNLRGGLVIMPVGIINVYHEPPTFNGVDRPDVDTLVIPSTWREPSVGIFGELSQGLRYQLYLVNGMNATGFTAESAIREGHQEAQLARASDWGFVARLDWEPRLGTVVGLSGYRATSGNRLRDTVGSVPVTLLEADVRTRMGGLSARAEVAVLTIGDAAALNTALANEATDMGLTAPAPIAQRSQGGYLELGYDLLRLVVPGSTQSVTLFGRFDYADTQASMPAGYMADPTLRRTTYTSGLVYRPIQQIGLKLDYRRHTFGAGDSHNELATAITWMF